MHAADEQRTAARLAAVEFAIPENDDLPVLHRATDAIAGRSRVLVHSQLRQKPQNSERTMLDLHDLHKIFAELRPGGLLSGLAESCVPTGTVANLAPCN